MTVVGLSTGETVVGVLIIVAEVAIGAVLAWVVAKLTKLEDRVRGRASSPPAAPRATGPTDSGTAAPIT